MTRTRCYGPGGRGCPCSYHTQTREPRRLAARRRRAKQRAARLVASVCCPVANCGTKLETRIVGFGRSETVCPGCERRNAGICADCSAPVDGMIGRTKRCAEHRIRRRHQNERRRMADEETRDRKNALARKRTKGNIEHRRKKAAQRKAWAAKNPDKVKRIRRRAALREGPARERYLARERRRHQKNRPKRLAANRKRYRLSHPAPACVCACGAAIEWSGTGRVSRACDRCCTPKQLRQRQQQRARRAAERAQPMEHAA